MAHLGDPLEDLGWALSPIWSWQDRDRPAYLIPRDEALDVWENSSAHKVDKKDLPVSEKTVNSFLISNKLYTFILRDNFMPENSK